MKDVHVNNQQEMFGITWFLRAVYSGNSSYAISLLIGALGIPHGKQASFVAINMPIRRDYL